MDTSVHAKERQSKSVLPKCPDCGKEMIEYYVGLVPIGLFHSLGSVTTYVCRNCGRILFYAKELARKEKRRPIVV